MGELKVRRIDPVVLKKIDDLAREKNISREEYVRRYLSRLAVMEEAEEIEENIQAWSIRLLIGWNKPMTLSS
ncbi:MAG: hypothetical protein ACLR71_18635 [[Clostridium] scindens]